MPTQPAKSRIHWLAISIIAPIAIVLFLISGFFQWSRLNCWNDYIDINSGRIRHVWYLLYYKVADHTEDTCLSRIHNEQTWSPDWRCVNTFSPFVHYSPHYKYHSAIYQMNLIDSAEKMIQFDFEAQQKVADTLLYLWQKTGSDYGANQYVQDIMHVTCRLHEKGVSMVKASDLPKVSDVQMEQ